MTSPYLPDPLIYVDEDGTPRSERSGDVYFSRHGGIAETRHVFLGGIGAPECWSDRSGVRIGELGFGTGLNFLVTWHDWAKIAPADATLDYVAIEGFPIEKETLAQILGGIDEVSQETKALLNTWPPLVSGVHRLVFEGGRVRLTLMLGDVVAMLDAMQGHVDAWFLDGFAPAKNPDMWTSEVLGRIAALSAPGGKIATFTAAGAVRRELADLGFDVQKRSGFGRKRDCIAARRPGDVVRSRVENIAVIGGGIAGTCLARALNARGAKVTLIDPAPGQGASGNPVALLAPRLPREQTLLGRIMAAAYLYALRFYDDLKGEGAEVWLGERGALTLARTPDEAERQNRALSAFGWPDDIMRIVDESEARKLAGTDVAKGGLWFKGAGALSPPTIIGHLSRDIACLEQAVGGFIKDGEMWQVLDDDGTAIESFDRVALAAGTGLMTLMADQSWPLRENRGQISYLKEYLHGPRVPVTYGGYVSPAIDLGDGARGHVLGATYARAGEVEGQHWHDLRDTDTDDMLENLTAHVPEMAGAEIIGGRVSHRTTIRDYTPLAGKVRDGLYVLGGLGSRGFLTAPLLSELIADQIFGAPLPLESDLVQALSPDRFKRSNLHP